MSTDHTDLLRRLKGVDDWLESLAVWLLTNDVQPKQAQELLCEARAVLIAQQQEIALVREAARDPALSDGAARAVACGTVPPTTDDVRWARQIAAQIEACAATDAALARLEQELRDKISLGIGNHRPRPSVSDDDLYAWADQIQALRRTGDEGGGAWRRSDTSTVDDWLTCTACGTVIVGAAWTGACPQCGNSTMREGRDGT